MHEVTKVEPVPPPMSPKEREVLRLRASQVRLLEKNETSVVRQRLAWFDQPLKKALRLEKRINRLRSKEK